MVIQHPDHFLLKETHIFRDFVKSEEEIAKSQVNSWQKKDVPSNFELKVYNSPGFHYITLR